MKRKIILSIFTLILFVISCFARLFFVGSNPSNTVFAYPQDIFLLPKDFVFYYTTFQREPWWGDLDQPDLRPSASYLLTGEKIGVKGSNDYFYHNSNLYNWKNISGFTYTFSPLFKTRFDLEYTYIPFISKAEAAMTDDIGNILKFNYSNFRSIHDFYFTSYFATKFKDTPLGFKFGAGKESSTQPKLNWEIIKNDTFYSVQRHVWSWSTLQGGRIFYDYDGHEHAHYQDDYTVGSLYRVDLQTAATLPRLKVGGRLRLKYGSLNQYMWQQSDTLQIPDPAIANLTGHYDQIVSKKISEKTIRIYGNYNWIKKENFLFNTLVLSRLTFMDSTGVDPANPQAESGIKEDSRTFVFQVNPNVNIYPWGNKFTYIDLAILCNYNHMSYDFTQPYWVGGGQKRSYVGRRVYLGEDYTWYECSYARQNFFEIALDLNPTIPVFGGPNQACAISLSMLLWTRFTWLNKYYGQFNTTKADFEIINIRKNYDRETWLNAVANIIYKRDAYNFRLMIGQPLTYSLTPQTRVYDASGKNLITEVKYENMWASQHGVQLGFFISTTLDNLFGIKTKN